MDFKQMIATVSRLITSPAIAWKAISHSESRAAMFNAYLYPLIMLCCLSAFLGKTVEIPFDEDLYYEELKKRIETSRLKEGTEHVFVNVDSSYGS